MKQYNQIKQKYPDALLLFRVGDFYETFGQDAVVASRILGIVLTKRANGSAAHIELAGFPHHSLETYLPKLIRAGQRVAICDQLEDPKLTKKIVKRGVTELVSPGLTTSDNVLIPKENNYLAAVHKGDKGQWGIAFCDLSTGEFFCSEGNLEFLLNLIDGFKPAEILLNKRLQTELQSALGHQQYFYLLDDWIFKAAYARDTLLQQFQTKSLKGFGIEDLESASISAGAIIHYLKESRHTRLAHIKGIYRLNRSSSVWMDRFTMRNLELFHSNSPNGLSLIDVIDRSSTAMGGRLLRKWLTMPLVQKEAIEERQRVVEHFMAEAELQDEVGEKLGQIADLERICARLSSARIGPKELLSLKDSLRHAEEIMHLCRNSSVARFHFLEKLASAKLVVERIEQCIEPEAPAQLHKGKVLRSGLLSELDDYRDIQENGKNKLLQIQQRESERTGISSLKIAYNNVFGYYLEVRNTHRDKVPEDWMRKQTLVNAERYITPELKEYEQKIAEAEERIQQLEADYYQKLVVELGEHIGTIQQQANAIAQIDVLSGFALLAKSQAYAKPEMVEDSSLRYENGRHPVIEYSLPVGERYVGNDLFLDREQQQIMMITGPNMSGKSALLRQTALISLLAQIGSYVPAQSAQLGIVDKIFVRVGASDNISQGESTFMVEMTETASILNNLSERSLVVLDEIGRGTSTYDGISIAWAIAQFLHEHPSKAKTLFATHYHELNEMEKAYERIVNFNVSVRESGDQIIFMRKLVEGGSAHSFGIHVAQMAGMPQLVVNRAQQMLEQLESSRQKEGGSAKLGKSDAMQLSFFQLDDPVLQHIRSDIKNLDLNTLTPIEAMMKLHDIKKRIGLE